MNNLKNKIEELKKDCRVLLQRGAGNSKILCGDEGDNKIRASCENCNNQIQAYEEAQEIFDETLKNILDEIDKLEGGLREDETDVKVWVSEVKQIIQKHSQESQGGSKTTDKITDSVNLPSSDPDTKKGCGHELQYHRDGDIYIRCGSFCPEEKCQKIVFCASCQENDNSILDKFCEELLEVCNNWYDRKMSIDDRIKSETFEKLINDIDQLKQKHRGE